MSGYSHDAAYDTGYLPVDDVHCIYYEQYGNKDGKPAVFLHGGPGGATSPSNAAFFDPSIYRVVLLDQRGAGKSTPTCELRNNTSQHLVDDIEKLRKHLGISKWHTVFGGSWGSTLALLYAQAYPTVVSSLILRGIFLFRQSELDWNHPITGGAAHIHPDVCEEFLKVLTEDEAIDWEKEIYKRLTCDNKLVRVKAARDFNAFDLKRSTLLLDPKNLGILDNEAWSLHHTTILVYYFVNKGFIREGQILEQEQIAKIRHIPCSIIQGRYDMVCPPQSAWDLHKALPDAKFTIVPDAGHSATETGIYQRLINACDEYASL